MHCGFPDAEKGAVWWVNQIFSDGYSTIAVPYFFIISGYFLARYVGERGWWKVETLKRVKTIVVPYLSWAVVYQLLFLPVRIYADMRAGRPFGTNVELVNGHFLTVFGLELDKWPCSVPLWYLRALFIFVLLSGVLVWILRRIPRIWIVSLFACSLALSFAPNPELGGYSGFLQRCFSVSGLMYFSIGMWLRLSDIHFDSRKAAISALLIGLSLLVVKIVLAYEGISLKPSLLAFAIPSFIYATWHFMPTTALPKFLKGVSFPIYLIHWLLFCYWGVVVRNAELNDLGKLVAWPLFFVGSIILAKVLSRIFPRFSAVLFGGR